MRKSFSHFLLMCAAGTVSSCANLGIYPPPWQNALLNPQPSYSASYRRSRYGEHPRVAHTRRVRHEAAPAAPVTAADADSAPVRQESGPTEAASTPPALTLAGDSGDRERALRLLDRVDNDLDRARSRPLTAAQRESYARASELANRARRALAENDCAAASSLARKARSLAAAVNRD
jgi:hypothetical protein